MKIIAINSSPVGDKGHTAMILNPFLEGMKEAGYDLITENEVSQELQDTVNQPLIPMEHFVRARE